MCALLIILSRLVHPDSITAVLKVNQFFCPISKEKDIKHSNSIRLFHLDSEISFCITQNNMIIVQYLTLSVLSLRLSWQLTSAQACRGKLSTWTIFLSGTTDIRLGMLVLVGKVSSWGIWIWIHYNDSDDLDYCCD